MIALLAVLTGLLGLAIGSFLNVVIWRVPRGESVVSPPSHCPHCDAPIRNRDNIPVLSWLLLRGRCRDCSAPISARYPAVELLTAAVFVVLTLRIGVEWSLPAYLYLGAIGVALALIDIDVRRLPDQIVLPSYPVALVLLTGASLLTGEWWSLGRGLIGLVALFAFYFLLALIYPSGMGFGDVKLAGLLGGVLGFISLPTLLVGAFAAFLLGGLAGGAVILSGRGSGKTALPFGPFMVGGTLLALFAAEPIADLYVTYALHA